MTRSKATVCGALTVTMVLLVTAGISSAQSPSSGGVVKVWGDVSFGAHNVPSPVLITGAIADHGTTQSVNASGEPDANGNYVKVSLTEGTFMVNTSQLNMAFEKAKLIDFNSSNCSASIAVSSIAVPVVNGSGTSAYTGIEGTLTMGATVAFILPKTKSGSCNLGNNAVPIASWGEITGTGTLTL